VSVVLYNSREFILHTKCERYDFPFQLNWLMKTLQNSLLKIKLYLFGCKDAGAMLHIHKTRTGKRIRSLRFMSVIHCVTDVD